MSSYRNGRITETTGKGDGVTRRRVNSVAGLVILLLFAVLGGVAWSGNDDSDLPPPVRVGITPNLPPLTFKLSGKLAGLEVDLATELAREMGRPVTLVEVKWEDQIPLLLAGETDIIMSGMSVTDVRKVRIDFTDPYLQGGLMAVVRLQNQRELTTKAHLSRGFVALGAVRDTTAHVFIEKNFPRAKKVLYRDRETGISELKLRRIDAFIDDFPSAVWIVSQNESYLMLIREPLNEEFYAWGIRKGDEALKGQLNTILKRWEEQGVLKRLKARWLPYLFKD